MSKIAILTDSACDIPAELAEEYGIDIMSFIITLDDVSYVERQDFTMDQYYEMLRNAKGLPSTAHITALQFCEQYTKYVDEGYTDVIHLCINRTGSATFDAATMAQGLLREERPEHHMKIHLIDSHTYSMAYGWPLCKMARRVRNGLEAEMAVAELEQELARSEVVLAAFSLKQLKKSGRVNAAAAFAGELLGLRPIISLIDGESKVQVKVRGDAAVLPALVKYVESHATDIAEEEYMIGCTDLACTKDLVKLCKKQFGHAPAQVFQLGAAVASNTGPDVVALVYLGAPRR